MRYEVSDDGYCISPKLINDDVIVNSCQVALGALVHPLGKNFQFISDQKDFARKMYQHMEPTLNISRGKKHAQLLKQILHTRWVTITFVSDHRYLLNEALAEP